MESKLTTVRLYGKLGAKFGRVHRLQVASVAEAVRALTVLCPGFDRFLTMSKDMGMAYACFYGKRNIGVNELKDDHDGTDIRIAPVIIGAKNGGWMNIIVGAVIIIVSGVIDYFTGGAFGAATNYSTYIMGATMILGGIVQLLTPVPKGKSAKDKPGDEPSYNFNGPANTQAQGARVAVAYGECMAGSAVLSAGINSVDQAYIPLGTPGAGSGGGGGGGAPPYHSNWQD